MSKAFDTVDHNVLVNKLPTYGLDVKLFSSSNLVVLEGNNLYMYLYNLCEEINIGVPQGSILGPI